MLVSENKFMSIELANIQTTSAAQRRLPRWTALLAAAAVVAATISGPAALESPLSARAASNASPTYQIKLRLDPAKVLDSNGKFTATSSSKLSISSESGYELAQYIDDSAQDLASEGWSMRIKRDNGAGAQKLTYKKRFSIANGGTAAKDINATLDTANDSGFSSSDTNYDAQVNMSYTISTLDFSNKKKASADSLNDDQLPGGADSIDVVQSNLPGKLSKWRSNNWVSSVIDKSRIYGPVRQSNYSATIGGHAVDLQLTPMKSQNGSYSYLEVSADATKLGDATAIRSDVIKTLDGLGRLLHENAFKTDLVLANY